MFCKNTNRRSAQEIIEEILVPKAGNEIWQQKNTGRIVEERKHITIDLVDLPQSLFLI
jgi:hypothetical protein